MIDLIEPPSFSKHVLLVFSHVWSFFSSKFELRYLQLEELLTARKFLLLFLFILSLILNVLVLKLQFFSVCIYQSIIESLPLKRYIC